MTLSDLKSEIFNDTHTAWCGLSATAELWLALLWNSLLCMRIEAGSAFVSFPGCVVLQLADSPLVDVKECVRWPATNDVRSWMAWSDMPSSCYTRGRRSAALLAGSWALRAAVVRRAMFCNQACLCRPISACVSVYVCVFSCPAACSQPSL